MPEQREKGKEKQKRGYAKHKAEISVGQQGIGNAEKIQKLGGWALCQGAGGGQHKIGQTNPGTVLLIEAEPLSHYAGWGAFFMSSQAQFLPTSKKVLQFSAVPEIHTFEYQYHSQ